MTDAEPNKESEYRYAGVPLMPAAMQELILELFPGQTVKRDQIVDRVRTTHLARGGLDSDAADFPRSVKRALAKLKARDVAQNPAYAMWRISGDPPPEPEIETESDVPETDEPNVNADFVFGAGRSAIYVYYFDTYRQNALANAEDSWPCKIGRTDRDPLNRILSQASTALPELPHVAIIFHTDDPSDWEHALHAVFRLRGNTTTDAPGVEWFDTSPEEILAIIRYIDPDQNIGPIAS